MCSHVFSVQSGRSDPGDSLLTGRGWCLAGGSLAEMCYWWAGQIRAIPRLLLNHVYRRPVEPWKTAHVHNGIVGANRRVWGAIICHWVQSNLYPSEASRPASRSTKWSDQRVLRLATGTH